MLQLKIWTQGEEGWSSPVELGHQACTHGNASGRFIGHADAVTH